MASLPSKQTIAQQAKLAQHALLDGLVGIVVKQASGQLLDVAGRMVNALLDLNAPGLDAREVYQRVKSGNLLKENSYAFVHLAAAELEKTLREELAILVPSLVKARPAVTELSLVPFEEMDNRVAFDVISRPFELLYATPIANLNLRLGLFLERDILRLPQNPFRPELFLTVIQQAWYAFEPDEQGHPLIQPLLRPDVLFDLAPVYEALVATLISKGAPAAAARGDGRGDAAAAAKTARARKKAELTRQLRQFLADDEGDDGIPLIPDLPASANSGNGGWRPSGAQGYTQPDAAVQNAAGTPVSAALPGPVHGFVPDHGGVQPSHAALFNQPAHSGYPAQAAQFVHAGGGFVAGTAMPAHQIHHAQGAHDGEHGVPTMSQAPLLDMLRSLQARMPAPMAGAAEGTPGTPGLPMAGSGHAGADVFYLPRLKESMPKGSLSRRDESTIDLLAKVFDTVFIDPNIPAEIRELIHFLQIPVLKAALADTNFFFEETHPARRMIDLMSRIGMEQRKGPDDPLFQAMQRSVESVGRDEDDQASGFTAALAELEASVQLDDSVAETAIAAPIAAALKQEKHTAACRSARHAVAARVSSGEVVAMLETFLEDRWTSVLTVAYTVEDDKPGAVNNATRTMDDLIWSVKPKITQEQRKSLIAKLPGLLATLNRWLDVIKWQDDDRRRFFSELAECHASIVRAPLDISPERQLEIAVEVAQNDAMRRLEKEQAAAAVSEEGAPELDIDDAAVAVESLERGQWFGFTQPDDTVRKVKLAWISPLRTLFIFSTGARQEAFSVPVEQLLTAFREDKVHLVRVDGVVGRALSEALGTAASNEPDASSAA